MIDTELLLMTLLPAIAIGVVIAIMAINDASKTTCLVRLFVQTNENHPDLDDAPLKSEIFIKKVKFRQTPSLKTELRLFDEDTAEIHRVIYGENFTEVRCLYKSSFYLISFEDFISCLKDDNWIKLI